MHCRPETKMLFIFLPCRHHFLPLNGNDKAHQTLQNSVLRSKVKQSGKCSLEGSLGEEAETHSGCGWHLQWLDRTHSVWWESPIPGTLAQMESCRVFWREWWAGTLSLDLINTADRMLNPPRGHVNQCLKVLQAPDLEPVISKTWVILTRVKIFKETQAFAREKLKCVLSLH